MVDMNKKILPIVIILFLIFTVSYQFVSNGNDTNNTTYTDDYESCAFRNDKLLEEHYEKHGVDMGYSSQQDYLDGACDVVNNNNSLHKYESDGDDIYYLEDTNEYVVVSTDGYIRTYFYPDDGIAYYNRK